MFSLHPKKYWFLTTSTFGQCLGNSMNFQPLCFLKVTKAPVSFQLADATRMVAIHSDPAPAVLGVASKVVFWSWSVDPFRCFSLGLLASLEREAHPIMYFLVIRQGSKILFEITPVTQMEQGVFLFFSYDSAIPQQQLNPRVPSPPSPPDSVFFVSFGSPWVTICTRNPSQPCAASAAPSKPKAGCVTWMAAQMLGIDDPLKSSPPFGNMWATSVSFMGLYGSSCCFFG